MKWTLWAILFVLGLVTLDFWADPRLLLVPFSILMIAPLFPLPCLLALIAATGLILVAHGRVARKVVGLLLFIAATCICYSTLSAFGGLAGGGHRGPSSDDIGRSHLLMTMCIGTFIGAVAVAVFSRVRSVQESGSGESA
jgi:hypothetical protein